MINKVVIKNFKSIVDLELELGRINVFIGANGSGKSNILEAIAFAEAIATNRLEREFLFSRGFRMTDPILMKSAFDLNTSSKQDISISVTNDNSSIEFTPVFENDWWRSDWGIFWPKEGKDIKEFYDRQIEAFTHRSPIQNYLRGYLMYNPSFQALREFERAGQISPLGINGAGLFKVLFSMYEDNSLPELKKHLELIDWFADFNLSSRSFEVGSKSFGSENYLEIVDKYLDKKVDFFDQQSTNEGFLFLLFYLALFISKETPQFFAIENIENSFNPKLCTKLIEVLTQLAGKHEKQALITTHNPAILDGINIHDDDQRLFVVERNQLGHTTARRIKTKEGKSLSIKLSQAFMNGYLGGLPINF